VSFLINNLIRTFLTQQAIGLVQREVTSEIERELRARLEASKQVSAFQNGQRHPVDFAIVFSQSNEAVGLLDRCPNVVVTHGNKNTFHTFLRNGKRVVVVVPADSSRDSLMDATHAVIDVFRPQRLVSAGFAVGIAPEIVRFSVCVPRVMSNTWEERTIDLRQLLLAATKQEVDSYETNPELTDNRTMDAGTMGAETTYEKASGNFEHSFYAASLVTTLKNFLTVAQKKELRIRYQTQLADRSQFPVIATCRKRQVPVLPLCVVTCTFDEEPLRDAGPMSHAHHARRFGAFLKNFVRRPSSAIDLVKFKQRRLEASDILAEHLFQLIDS